MRLGRMWSVAAAADGATSKHSAQGPPQDADGARRSRRRKHTGAPLKDARQRSDTGASTPLPSVETAGAPTSPRLMPVRRRERPAVTQRGGDHPPCVEAARQNLAARRAPTDVKKTPRGEIQVQGSTSLRRRRPWRSRGTGADRAEGGQDGRRVVALRTLPQVRVTFCFSAFSFWWLGALL